MREFMKKAICLALALAMAVSVSACSGDGGGSSSTDNSSSGGASESSEETIEEVTLSVYMPDSALTTGGIQTDPIAEQIKKETGVTMDVTINDNDKTQAMVASGDLYDVNVLGSLEYVEPLIKTGALSAMDDYLQYAPILTENFQQLLDYSRDYLSAGTGKVYVLPARANSEELPVSVDQNGTFMRWDYYKEAGMPEINSIDDYLELLADIQEKHPTTEDGKKVYGVSSFVDWGAYCYTEYSILTKVKGIMSCGELQSYNLSDLSYYDLYDDNNLWWQNAELNWKANQMGLLDPETYVQNHDALVQKLTEGRVLTSPVYWEVKNLPLESNQKFVDIPFADTAEFTSWVTRNSPLGYAERMWFLSSNMDDTKMKAALRLLNWLYSPEGNRVIVNGVEGGAWNLNEDGEAELTEEAIEALTSADASSFKDSYFMDKYTGLRGLEGTVAYNGLVMDLASQNDIVKLTLSDAEKEYCDHFGVEVPLDVFVNRENQSNCNKAHTSLMTTDIPTDVSRITTSVLNYMMQEVPNLVDCATEQEYDAKVAAMKEEIKNMGYDTVSEFYKESFTNAVAEWDKLSKAN